MENSKTTGIYNACGRKADATWSRFVTREA